MDNGHREWLLARQSGIGGSDIAAILGLSKWRTAAHVYLSKTTPIADDEATETENQFIGKAVEGAILDMYEHRTGEEVIRTGNSITRDKDVEYFLGSYDGVVDPLLADVYVVDAKSVDVSRAEEWGPDGSGICPEDYAVQLLWYEGIGNFPKGDLAALIGGRHFRIVTIERADEVIRWMREAADRFWHEHVLKLNPPPIDVEHRFALDVAKKIYNGITPGTAKLHPTEFLQRVLAEYFTGQAMESAGKKMKRRSKVVLMEMTGNFEKAEILGTDIEVTRKPVHKDPYTVEAQDYIDLRVKLPRGAQKPLIEAATPLLAAAAELEEEETTENE